MPGAPLPVAHLSDFRRGSKGAIPTDFTRGQRKDQQARNVARSEPSSATTKACPWTCANGLAAASYGALRFDRLQRAIVTDQEEPGAVGGQFDSEFAGGCLDGRA